VLGVGSYTYQYNTRDTFGYAAKGAWFESEGKGYDIYKDPATDDGTKKSLRGFCPLMSIVPICRLQTLLNNSPILEFSCRHKHQ